MIPFAQSSGRMERSSVDTAPVMPGSPALAAFLAGANKIAVEYRKANFPALHVIYETYTEAQWGVKYIRLVRKERSIASGQYTSGSAIGLIEILTGNVYMTAGWAGPDKKSKNAIRGNIFAADGGLTNVGPYGVKRLR